MRLRDLQAAVSVSLVLMGPVVQSGSAQQVAPAAAQSTQTVSSPTAPAAAQAVQNDTTGNPALPQAPQPKLTEPLFLRDTGRDYTRPKKHFANPLAPYTATSVPMPRLANSAQLDSLLKDGKIYLSLSDAIALALENNFDIAIARINLDIADTDLLRAKAGSTLRGVSTGIVANTLGGSTTTITGGGGPGGTSSSAGGGGTGASGLVLSTNGGGPVPEALDPVLTGVLEYESNSQPTSSSLSGVSTTTTTPTTTTSPLPNLNTDTSTYNFGYVQGFLTGTQLNVTFNNSRVTTNNSFNSYQPGHYLHLSRHRDAASAAGLWLGRQRSLHPAGEERSPHNGLCVPPAAPLHGESSREHLLGPGQRI